MMSVDLVRGAIETHNACPEGMKEVSCGGKRTNSQSPVPTISAFEIAPSINLIYSANFDFDRRAFTPPRLVDHSLVSGTTYGLGVAKSARMSPTLWLKRVGNSEDLGSTKPSAQRSMHANPGVWQHTVITQRPTVAPAESIETVPILGDQARRKIAIC